MTFVITANNLDGRDNRPPAPALKDNGENFEWRMFYNQNSEIVDADSLAECLEQLIPNYMFMNVEDAFQARVSLAKSIQMAARVTILANQDLSQLQEWETEVLSFSPDNEHLEPYGWGDGSGKLGTLNPDAVDVWSAKVPLVLVESNFEPFTNLRRPVSSEGDYVYVSNIIWLEPVTELDFLKSLSRIGFVSFGTPRSDRN